MNYFADLDVSNIRNKTIFLDVDGTILNDGQNNIGHRELLKIEQIKVNNTIYLCSNKKDHYRNSLIAENCGVHYLKSDYRKPSKKAFNLPNFNHGDSIVIGDKFLTDGLFAGNVGALFIKVKRIISPKDSFFVKFIYFFDNLVYFSFVCIKALRPNQWVKNLLVFIPVFFAKEIFVASKFLNATYIFLIFCLMASAMYIINDTFDKQQDKKHYKKN